GRDLPRVLRPTLDRPAGVAMVGHGDASTDQGEREGGDDRRSARRAPSRERPGHVGPQRNVLSTSSAVPRIAYCIQVDAMSLSGSHTTRTTATVVRPSVALITLTPIGRVAACGLVHVPA